jgi:NAD(P)-dependent dehydrogenase (short-subunit alcohol dehydrogenase family)
MKLDGKVALLTHCGNPLGRAVALALAGEGASISLCGFPASSSALEEIAREVERMGRKSIAREGDLTVPLQVQSIVKDTLENLGEVDILVNAIAEVKELPRFLEQLTSQGWDEAMNLGLKSTFLFCQAVSKIMKGQKGGKIINLSSRGGRTGEELSSFAEVTAKAGIFGLTRQVAHQLGPFGIRVNAIAAGIVVPGWPWEKEWGTLDEKKKEAFLAQIPLRRFARPEEIAQVVVFLASDDSSYITGATVDVNGGQLFPIFPPRSETLSGR